MDFLGLTTATAPWFAAAFLTGTLGVIGIISGAVVTYKSVKASDLRKQEFDRERIALQYKREDAQRWYTKLSDLCTELVTIDSTISSMRGGVLKEHNARQLLDNLDRIRANRPLDELESDERRAWFNNFDEVRIVLAHDEQVMSKVTELGVVLSKLQVIAPTELGKAAWRLWEATIDTGDRPYDNELVMAHTARRDEFLKIVHGQLGVNTRS